MSKRISLLTVCILSIVRATLCYADSAPIKVQSYYVLPNAKNTEEQQGSDSLKSTPQLSEPVQQDWRAAKPARPYRIAALIPHINDPYWITATYALSSYAEALGIQLSIYTFDGYIKFGDQRHRLRSLANQVDAILLSSIDPLKMESTLAEIEIPVIGLINNIESSVISAKAMVSYYDAGYQAGEYVKEDAQGKTATVAFFPGPNHSGWAEDMYTGFSEALITSGAENITIYPPMYGDTRPEVQRLRVATFFKAYKDHKIDYIVGNAVAIEQAALLQSKGTIPPDIKLVSTYLTRSIYDLIRAGDIKAAPYDHTIELCQIAIDMAVKTLNGGKPGIDFAYHAKPEITLITEQNITQFSYSALFGPTSYTPKVIRPERN